MSSSYSEFDYIMEELGILLEEFAPAILAVLLIVLLITLVIGVVFYVLQSVGLHTIAKRRGIRNPWLAWIPIGNYWILGCISDQYQYVVKGKVKNRRKIMLILSIASIAVSLVVNVISQAMLLADGENAFGAIALSSLSSLINSGISIASVVFWHIALYDLYSSCCPENNVLFLVLGIIFSVTQPFFLFCSRNKDRGMPPRRPQPQYVPQPEAYQPPQYEQPYTPPQEPWQNSEQQ